MMLALLEIIFGDGRFTIHKFCEFTGPLFVELNKLIHFLVITHFGGRSWWTRRTWGSCRTWKRPILEVYNPAERPVWKQCDKFYCLDVISIVQTNSHISRNSPCRSIVALLGGEVFLLRGRLPCTPRLDVGRVNDLGGMNRMVLRNSINANTKEKEIRETVKRDL